MGQKQVTRSRSKSASRKSLTESKSENTPIITNRKRTVKNDKESDNNYIASRRVTRQFTRVTSTSLDDWNVDDHIPNTSGDDSENVKVGNDSMKDKGEIKNSWFEAISKAFFSILFIVFVPLVVLFLNKLCETKSVLHILSLTEIKLEYFVNYPIIALVAMWLLLLSCLSILPIGTSHSVSLADGFQLRYRCNGIFSLVVSIALLSWILYSKYLTTDLIYSNYYSIIGSSISLAIIISLIVYLKSFFNKTHVVPYSDNIPFCFLMGREINPRILGLDLKYFYEFRPGFISWALLNIIFCVKDWEEKEYQSINFSLLLCVICQLIYCIDSLIFESDNISKAFMLNGKFGFVHCFGSQVIVPFLFTLTSRTIQINKLELPLRCLAFIALLNFIAFIIYRSSNSQKNDFRRNPYSTHIYHLKSITTEHGKQLLTGGWWGLLRHPNYVGDILMSICWSLCAGSTLVVCWIYPSYFLIFIVCRCIQDEANCALKHGKGWVEYKRCVPYRLVPFIF